MEQLNKENFEEKVSSGISVVDFFSESCEPCKALMPKMEELEAIYKEQMPFYKLDTAGARRLAIKLRVLGLPTVAVFKNGEKVEELTKEDATVENIEAMVKKYL